MYLAAARAFSQQMDDVIADLVSEARARGSSWVEIGEALEVGDTAVQKRYGKGITSELRLQLTEEAFVIDFVTRMVSGDSDEEIDEFLEELEGTTPADRVQYAFEIIRGALSEFDAVQDELRKDEPDATEVWRRLFDIHEKNALLVTSLLVGSRTMEGRCRVDWSRRQPGRSKLLLTCRLHLSSYAASLAGRFLDRIPLREDEPDFGQVMKYFMKANNVMNQDGIYSDALDDVNSASSFSRCPK